MPTAPYSHEQIAALLDTLSFPALTENAIDQIQGIEGNNFGAALERISRKGSDWELRKEYVLTVTAAVSPVTRQVIEACLRLRVPDLGSLIEISKTEGRAFRASIRQLAAEPNEQSPEADYLRRVIAPYTSRLPTPDKPVGHQQSATPPANARRFSAIASEGLKESTAFREEGLATKKETTSPYVSTHLYGAQAAFCFSHDITKGGRQPTVRIEATKSAGNKKYNWDQKVSFQCSVGELALLFGVFYGYLAQVELAGHGTNNEKSLFLEDQGNSCFIRLRVGGGSVLAVPIQARDTLIPMAMFLDQLKLNFPTLSDQALLLLIQRVCDKHNAPERRNAA